MQQVSRPNFTTDSTVALKVFDTTFERQMYTHRPGALLRMSDVVANAPVLVSDRSPDAVAERMRRMAAHRTAYETNPLSFHRTKNDVTHHAEGTKAMSALLNDCHPSRPPRDLRPPTAGYTFSRPKRYEVLEGPDWVDHDIGVVRPRTTGYSPGHTRSLTGSLPMGSRLHASTVGSATVAPRFNSLANRSDWTKTRNDRLKSKAALREWKKQRQREQEERIRLAAETRECLAAFESTWLSGKRR